MGLQNLLGKYVGQDNWPRKNCCRSFQPLIMHTLFRKCAAKSIKNPLGFNGLDISFTPYVCIRIACNLPLGCVR